MYNLCAVTLATILVSTLKAQTSTFPPPPVRSRLNSGLSAFSEVLRTESDLEEEVCDLSYPDVFRDPSILSTRRSFTRLTSSQNLLRNNPTAQAYQEGLRVERRARDEGVRQSLPLPPTGQFTLSYLVPTKQINICDPVMNRVSLVTNNGDICETFPDDEIDFAECRRKTADVPNMYSEYISKYMCVPDDYQQKTFMVFCPGTDELFRWHTVTVPTNCCGRKYACDFTPYQSLTGPILF